MRDFVFVCRMFKLDVQTVYLYGREELCGPFDCGVDIDELLTEELQKVETLKTQKKSEFRCKSMTSTLLHG